MGDKNQLYIFDIDSALDRLELENDLIETFSTNNSSTQKIEITKQQQQQQQLKDQEIKSTHIESEENGNLTTSNNNSNNNNNDIEEQTSINNESYNKEEELSVEFPRNEKEEETSVQYEDTIRSDYVENGQSLSIDEKFIAAAPSSTTEEINSSSTDASTTTSNSSSGNEYEIKKNDHVPLHFDTSHDDSSKRLLSEESSYQNDVEIDNDNDDQVTTDLTLTKTVEPTEYDPEPEEDEIKLNGSEQIVEKDNEIVKIQEPIVEKIVVEEEPNIKEMSHNFESTMDDISDAELESLEQELDDLVAAAMAENSSLEKVCEENVAVVAKSVEESVENTVEIEKTEIDEEAVSVEAVVSEKESDLVVKAEKNIDEIEKDMKPSDEEEECAKSIEKIESEVIADEQQQQESISEAQEATEPSSPQIIPQAAAAAIDLDDPALSTSSTDESTSIQNLPSHSNEDFSINESNSTGSLTSQPDLGKVPPYWIPDNMTNQCMQCDQKFSLIKRRHHCRACGLLLCASCCSEKFQLQYLGNTEGRICGACHEILLKAQQQQQQQQPKNPNPANPSEYCSTIPVQQQVSSTSQPQSITVMVPTGVLKRTSGSRSSERKSVIFSDGIRPGTDLDESNAANRTSSDKTKYSNLPTFNEKNNSFIPESTNDLPPILIKESEYKYVDNNLTLLQRLRQEELKFAINKNFYVTVKIVTLICCTNKTVINFSTSGLLPVRSDEIMILLELNDDMKSLPKEVFLHLNEIYSKADKSNVIIKEYGYSQAASNNFLGAFGGFLFIKPSFQCLQSLTLPENPYLIGILVHKWEVPWMRLFPLRLILRLGALYRYYPTPILSNVTREPVFAEIGNTIMNFLVDFRNFSYTIEIIKGLNIHMEEKKTSVFIPRNRYDQIMKVINNSTDHLLAFGADFSKQADGHLVCIQNIDSGSSESLSYSTQAINIQGQNRIRTGASFLILNGALKQSSGLKGKCSIVEDGLMIQIFSTKMQSVRDALKNMKNIDIPCGPIEVAASEQKDAEEVVSIEWVDDDLSFNIGVRSPIDDLSLEGKESIRTRLDITSQSHTKILRWCEVFLLESDDAPVTDDHLNYSKVCEPIAKAIANALLPFLDLMAVNQLRRIGIRVTLGENIKYLAGSNKLLFSPIYMNALDNELIAVIHRQASNLPRDSNLTMELIFYILNK